MAHRRFRDRDGNDWEVRIPSRDMWELSPVGDNAARPRTVPAPGYERDPYELSLEELQRLLDGSAPTMGHLRRKSPFID
jgi:hypothetical protein